MNPLNQSLLTVAELLLILALPIVIVAALQHLRATTARLKSQLSEDQQKAIDAAIKVAVSAAEQTGIVQNLIGPEKKQQALQIAESFLRKKGIDLDLESLSILIEAEVRTLNAATLSSPDHSIPFSQQALVNGAIEAAVMAAEQSGLKGLVQNVGTEKKAYAIDMANKFLAGSGITLDQELVDGLIEAQLMRLFLAARGQLPAGTSQ